MSFEELKETMVGRSVSYQDAVRSAVQWVADNGFEIRYSENRRWHTCSIELDGRSISPDELLAFAKSKGWKSDE